MLSEKQLDEIRGHLYNSQNPLFFFDNDADGLCSFLLLRRFLGRGKGIPVRSFPELNASYLNRVSEFGSDYVFILDKPVVSDEFFLRAKEMNLPVVWIDHHINESVPESVHYYNSLKNKDKFGEPVTYICYKTSGKDEDIWIAVAGCISDNFVPDFYQDFRKKYPDLTDEKSESAFDIFYMTQVGKIARIFNFALKDRTTNVIRMMKFLIGCTSPYDVLEETAFNQSMHKKFSEVSSNVQNLLKRAENMKNKNKLIFFQYSGKISISADIANELSYRYPDKVIIVAYINGKKANISARGKGVKGIVVRAVSRFKDATGGGHEDASGARINAEDLLEFKKMVEELV